MIKRITLPVIVIISLFGAISLLQKEIDLEKGKLERIQDFNYPLPGRVLKIAALEFHMVAADLLWLQAVQLMGEKQQALANYNRFYNIVDRVTDLDPAFSFAYQAGAISLSVLNDYVDLSNTLLQKGIRNNVNDWNIQFLLAFNYFYHLKDFSKAAHYMEKASRLEGSPPYLPFLAARFYSQGGDPRTAILFLQGLYIATKDERMREKLAERIAEMAKEIASQSAPK
jgi:hypothetical protein